MKRVISVYLPTLSTDRFRQTMSEALPPRKPFILIARSGSKWTVTAADDQAKRLGITLGMTATQATALVADLHIEQANASADAEMLECLAQWALQRYSPVISVDSNGLMVDATGAAHLFGGEWEMLEDMKERLSASGYAARIAMAPTYGAAHAFARFATEEITVTAAEFRIPALKLPVTALRLEPNIIQHLYTLGIETVGELEAMNRAPLIRRFGPSIATRLDHMFGREPELFTPLLPPEPISVSRHFAEPIAAHETLVRYITKLVTAIGATLESKNLGARTLDMVFHRVDNRIESIRIGLAKPSRDIKRLIKLFCDKLDTVNPGYGIEHMRLTATWVETIDYKQVSLDATRQTQADLANLVDTLTNRLGPGHLYQIAPVESDVPERSVARIEPLTPIASSWKSPWPRPVRLFPKPEPIETIAMLPDYPPVSFTWRGKRHKVAHADGPERIFGEWWKRDAEIEASRDYFQLEDEYGERFWVYRSGDGVLPGSGSQKWFMHGLFACAAGVLVGVLDICMNLADQLIR